MGLSKEISFKLAKLLKEKEYDKYTSSGYTEKGDRYLHQGGQEPVKNRQSYYEGRDYKGDKFHCSAPTIAEVVDWIYEKYGIWIIVDCDCYGELWYAKLSVASEKNWDNLDLRHEILSASKKFPNEHNVLRLCVCLPLAQCFNLTTNLMGQIAQNRCYLLVRLFSRILI